MIPLGPFSDSRIFRDVLGIERQMSKDYAFPEAARSKDVHLHNQRLSGIVSIRMSPVSSSSLVVVAFTTERFPNPSSWNTAEQAVGSESKISSQLSFS